MKKRQRTPDLQFVTTNNLLANTQTQVWYTTLLECIIKNLYGHKTKKKLISLPNRLEYNKYLLLMCRNTKHYSMYNRVILLGQETMSEQEENNDNN